MANGQDDAPASAADAFPRRPRPTPTIDLKATEVGAGTETSADAPPSEPPIPPAAGKGKAWWPSHLNWSLVEAGAAGGGIVLLVLAVLWFAGIFSSRDDGLNALQARLALAELKLQDIPGAPPASIGPKTVDDLAARLSKLEAAVSAPRPPSSDAAAANRVAAVEETVKSLQAKLADLDRRAEDNATAVREARGRADAAVLASDAMPAEAREVQSLGSRIAALEQTTKAFSEDLAKRAAIVADRPVRLAVAAQALRAAVERGGPFAAELAAVKPLAGDAQTLTPLEPFAAGGVPTPAALARQLSELVPPMRRLVAAPAPVGGFLNRLQAHAERLVRVRPLDETPGDDPEAIISRIDAKAARSDIAGALADLTKLPANVRAPAEDWIKQAQAREAAVASSRKFAGDALAALGKSP
ncbi:MAG: hypothetical protein QOJ96_314 [Alphaproteobacteria bacterium]|jgi:hypothetical protein|nr:hypothetical protein [Alphaproteobacteria bacterium]